MGVFFLSLFSLTAFAANSILCRLALKENEIGPVEFTSIRILSGCVVLLPVFLFHSPQKNTWLRTGWKEALALFVYAYFFSLAYVRIDAGSGALILFAVVQVTMIGVSLYQGKPMSRGEWLGLGLTFSGLAYMLSPGLQTPSLLASLFMAIAGAAWGFYSVWGQAVPNPFFATAKNFLFAAPLGLLILLLLQGPPLWSFTGVVLAMLSGAVTSGLGYLLWYLALRRLALSTAAILQLSVPLLAVLGGVLFLQEPVDLQLILSAFLILGGIFLSLWVKNHRRKYQVGSIKGL